MDYRDYYKIIGVNRKAGADEIRRAYRKLAMKHHPDLNPSDKKAEEKLKEVNEAYAVLNDNRKRSRYDQLDDAYARWRQNGGTGTFNWEKWLAEHDTLPPEPKPEIKVEIEPPPQPIPGSQGVGFSDFFNLVFGQGSSNGKSGVRRTAGGLTRHYDYPIRISLEEAWRGAERTLQVEGKLIKVKIPAGAKTGSRVRLTGAGPAGPQGRKTDLYLVVQVLEDERFEIKDDDIFAQITLDLFTAILGGEIEVPTPGGNVLLIIPTGTQPGQTFRLLGRGMPCLQNPQEFGNLYIQAKIEIPRQLTPKQRAAIEKVRKELL